MTEVSLASAAALKSPLLGGSSGLGKSVSCGDNWGDYVAYRGYQPT